MNHSWVFRENSLDIIRLIAAMQVCILHSFEFMAPEKTDTFFFEILRLFPGVPIFFFISGYLISKSYESTPNLLEYSRNRALRIYPALFICVLVNIIMVWSTGYLDSTDADASGILFLFAAKTTFLQFYNPEFMRGFGDGVLNGSLWTICVELQFYLIVPFLYLIINDKQKLNNTKIILLIMLFLVANRLLYITADAYSNNILWKLYRVSFIPWVYMFLTGMLVQRNFNTIASVVTRFPIIITLAAYVITVLICRDMGLSFYGNNVSPIIFFILTLLVFHFSYFQPKQTNKLLNGNDISYGVYIWHMPIVNQFLYYNYDSNALFVILTITITIILSIFSWKIIEKPALSLKRVSLHVISNKDR